MSQNPQKDAMQGLLGLGLALFYALTVLGGGFLGLKIGEWLGLTILGVISGLFLGLAIATSTVYLIFSE